MGVLDAPDEEPEEPEPGEASVPGPDAPREPDAPRGTAPAEDSVEDPEPDSPKEIRTKGEEYADTRQQADGDWTREPFKAPRAELEKFDPERAGLPAMSLDAANKYIAENRDLRPWLAMTDEALPEACRIIAVSEAAGGHGHIRHDGWVTEEANMRRVLYLEDPAQLEPEKRSLGIDGLRPNNQSHWCSEIAARIADPDAFATAFARGTEHPLVREVLDREFDPGKRPRAVTVPIEELLGAEGYKHCTGWRLEPVAGSMDTARSNRSAWISAIKEGREPDVPEPLANPVPTFKDGVILFRFLPNHIERRYVVSTLFPDPPNVNRLRGA